MLTRSKNILVRKWVTENFAILPSNSGKFGIVLSKLRECIYKTFLCRSSLKKKGNAETKNFKAKLRTKVQEMDVLTEQNKTLIILDLHVV